MQGTKGKLTDFFFVPFEYSNIDALTLNICGPVVRSIFPREGSIASTDSPNINLLALTYILARVGSIYFLTSKVDSIYVFCMTLIIILEKPMMMATIIMMENNAPYMVL